MIACHERVAARYAWELAREIPYYPLEDDLEAGPAPGLRVAFSESEGNPRGRPIRPRNGEPARPRAVSLAT